MAYRQNVRHKWLMATFISIVIVSGLFGPYMISILLTALSAACFAALS